jgi:hypothetical protein
MARPVTPERAVICAIEMRKQARKLTGMALDARLSSAIRYKSAVMSDHCLQLAPRSLTK